MINPTINTHTSCRKHSLRLMLCAVTVLMTMAPFADGQIRPTMLFLNRLRQVVTGRAAEGAGTSFVQCPGVLSRRFYSAYPRNPLFTAGTLSMDVQGAQQPILMTPALPYQAFGAPMWINARLFATNVAQEKAALLDQVRQAVETEDVTRAYEGFQSILNNNQMGRGTIRRAVECIAGAAGGAMVYPVVKLMEERRRANFFKWLQDDRYSGEVETKARALWCYALEKSLLSTRERLLNLLDDPAMGELVNWQEAVELIDAPDLEATLEDMQKRDEGQHLLEWYYLLTLLNDPGRADIEKGKWHEMKIERALISIKRRLGLEPQVLTLRPTTFEDAHLRALGDFIPRGGAWGGGAGGASNL